MNTVGLPACPRGNSMSFKLVIKVNGNPIDITGYSFAFIANRTQDKTVAPPVSINWTQLSPAPNGATAFTVSDDLTSTLDPGSYFYNLDMQDLIGTVTTIMAGTWPITPVPGLMSGAP